MIIGRLKGEIAAIGTDNVLIDVNGVGYVAQTGSRLLSQLRIGETAELHIETKVTENSITLFAFPNDDTRAWFVRLQDVHGVAGRAAMAILDAISVNELMDALALGDAATIQRAKGVGKKLAERILIELAGKAPPLGRFGPVGEKTSDSAPGTTPPPVQSSNSVTRLGGPKGARAEALSGLQNLGYAATDASRAIASAIKSGANSEDVSDLIRAALRELTQ